MSLNAAPRAPISSREATDARASKSPAPTRRAAADSTSSGRMITEPIATVSTPAAAAMVRSAIRI